MAKKKMVETQQSKDESFYVGIRDPTQFRREILSASKNIIISLKQIEILREQRKQKEIFQAELSKKVREINFLVGKLKNLIPEQKLRAIPSELIKPVSSEIKQTKKELKQDNNKVKQKHLTELDKLERELALIESKMQTV
jgi:hypothetical protein